MHAEDTAPFVDLLFLAMPVLPFVYLVLQISALRVMRGGLLRAAGICGLTMLALIAFVLWATVVMGSNIAPIYIVFAIPLLTLVLVVLWVIHILTQRRSG